MLRGTRIIDAKEALHRRTIINHFIGLARSKGYSEIALPNIIEQQLFLDKAGPEILSTMYTFKDKGDRDICLVPEATAILQAEYKAAWQHDRKKPVRLFYIQRCYRYDRPQTGRYREFTQLGVECMGGKAPEDREEVIGLLKKFLDENVIDYEFKDAVKRGLSYYVEDGFEVECASLGAQKQIAGGGRYDCGIGFAIGLDRLMILTEEK